MWLFLGFVSFFISACVLLYRKLYVCWTPDEIKANNSWRYKHYKNKDSITQVSLGLNRVRDYHFSFVPKSERHKFGKWCGLAQEFQTGDTEFDRLIYILSDNEFLHKVLASSPDIRRAVVEIFNYGVPGLAVTEEIVCANGNLWVRLKTGAQYAPGYVDHIAKALMPHLTSIREALNKIPPRDDLKLWREPFFLKAMLLVSVSSGLAINACLQLSRIWFMEFPFLLEPADLLPLSVTMGFAISVLLVVVLFLWIGRSARTHLVFFEIVTLGLLGAIATAFVELRDYNVEKDRKSPTVQLADVESVYSHHGRRTGTKYYVKLRDWRCDCDSIEIRIPYYLYSELKTGDKADVLEHSGALGYHWVSELRKHQ